MSRTPIERVHQEIAASIGALDLQLESEIAQRSGRAVANWLARQFAR